MLQNKAVFMRNVFSTPWYVRNRSKSYGFCCKNGGDLTHKHLKKPTTHEMFHFEMIRTEALSLPGSLSAPRHGALRGNAENLQGSRDSWLSGFRSFYPKAWLILILNYLVLIWYIYIYIYIYNVICISVNPFLWRHGSHPIWQKHPLVICYIAVETDQFSLMIYWLFSKVTFHSKPLKSRGYFPPKKIVDWVIAFDT